MLGKLNQIGQNNQNWDDMRLKQAQEILDKCQSDVTEDDIIYIKNCIKHFQDDKFLKWLKNLQNNGDITQKSNNLAKQKKINELKIYIPRISFLSQLEQESNIKLFEKIIKPNGSIITVPRAGTSDLFLLAKGIIVIFVLNSLQLYKQPFIIVGCHHNNGTFNESLCLFNKESQYGSIVLGSEIEAYKIDKQGLSSLNDQDSLSILRGIFQSKDRLYKNLLDKMQNMNTEQEIIDFQEQICLRNKLNFDEIKKIIQKNYKSGIIESTDKQELKEKNLKIFEQKMGNDPLKNALSKMTDRERMLCLGTPRIAHGKKDGFFGMTAQQENSLFALRQLGTNIRKGIQTTNSVLPADQNEIINAKNSLLDEEKILAAEIANKKSFSERKLKSDNQMDQQFDVTIKQKLEKNQEDIIKKLESIKLKEQEQEQQQQQQNMFEKSLPIKKDEKIMEKKQPVDMEISRKRKNIMNLGI